LAKEVGASGAQLSAAETTLAIWVQGFVTDLYGESFYDETRP
jgi:hypothetical protein